MYSENAEIVSNFKKSGKEIWKKGTESFVKYNNQDTVFLKMIIPEMARLCLLHDNRIFMFEKKYNQKSSNTTAEETMLMDILTTAKYRIMKAWYIIFYILNNTSFLLIFIMSVIDIDHVNEIISVQKQKDYLFLSLMGVEFIYDALLFTHKFWFLQRLTVYIGSGFCAFYIGFVVYYRISGTYADNPLDFQIVVNVLIVRIASYIMEELVDVAIDAELHNDLLKLQQQQRQDKNISQTSVKSTALSDNKRNNPTQATIQMENFAYEPNFSEFPNNDINQIAGPSGLQGQIVQSKLVAQQNDAFVGDSEETEKLLIKNCSYKITPFLKRTRKGKNISSIKCIHWRCHAHAHACTSRLNKKLQRRKQYLTTDTDQQVLPSICTSNEMKPSIVYLGSFLAWENTSVLDELAKFLIEPYPFWRIVLFLYLPTFVPVTLLTIGQEYIWSYTLFSLFLSIFLLFVLVYLITACCFCKWKPTKLKNALLKSNCFKEIKNI